MGIGQAEPPKTGKSYRYKGASPFQDTDLDRKIFFGRKRESRSLLHLVGAEQLVVLFAKSGIGKTSLINAGLLEPLRGLGYFPMVVRVDDQKHGPVRSILDGVLKAAERSGVDCVNGDDSSLGVFFKTAEFWSIDDDPLPPVLILDQFEELFTLQRSDAGQEFIRQLAEVLRGYISVPPGGDAAVQRRALESHSPDVKIVLSLREDYLANLQDFTRQIPAVLQNRFRLRPLTKDTAREAIVGPAELKEEGFLISPFSYEPEAIKAMLSFVGKERRGDQWIDTDQVEPFNLQLICQHAEAEVREKNSAPVVVSRKDVGSDAEMRHVVGHFYENTIAAIPAGRRTRAVQRLCERQLIDPSSRRRRSIAEDEIVRELKVPESRLRWLVDAHLLRAEPRLGGTSYELTHDTLVEPILESRKRREAPRRRLFVLAGLGGCALVVSAGWMITLHQAEIERRQSPEYIDSLTSEFWKEGDMADAEARFESARSALDAIEETPANGLAGRSLFGGTMFILKDVALRTPDLRERALGLRADIRNSFVEATGLLPPDDPRQDILNPAILIEGGTFLMGSADDDLEAVKQEPTLHGVTVSSFYLQEHEVTNAEYRRFDPDREPGAPADFPVVNVSWYEAMAYAAWLGGSLPSEAQWEFAARGVEGRLYPWGNQEPTCDLAQYFECGSSVVAVKSKPAGATPEEIYDLAGNVWEFCADWYETYSLAEQTDPHGPATGTDLVRVARGGSVNHSSEDLRGARRGSEGPLNSFAFLGFRVAWGVSRGPEN